MTVIANSPFPVYLDTDGSALEDGYLYIGSPNQNPETNPITVYWDADYTTPAAQPIRTSGGFAVRNGSPAMMYVLALDYSITVRDKNRRLVYSKLENDSTTSQLTVLDVDDVFTGNGATTVYTLSKLPSSQAGLDVSVSGVTQTPGTDYTLTANTQTLTFSTAPPNGAIILVKYSRSITVTLSSTSSDFINVKNFGAIGNGVADDTAAVQAALDYAYGRPVYAPAGTYKITSPITSYNASLVKRPGVVLYGDGPGITIFDNQVASGYCFDFNHSVGSTTYANQVWSDSSSIKNLTILGNASIASSSGIKVRGLWNLVFDQVVIKNHTLYGFHADVDPAYNPDMTASVSMAFRNCWISYNKIGMYSPQSQAMPACTCTNVYVFWNTDAGIIMSSGIFKMAACGISFNGYSYSGDFSPSLSYGGFINPLVNGCPSGISFEGCEFDGNKPQQIYSALSSGMKITHGRFGVRRLDGELNKYMVVFGADTTVGTFRCYDPLIEHCEINFKSGDYTGVTVRPFMFKTYSRYGKVGNNQWFSTATNLTAGTNLFYVTEDARTGGDDGALYAVKYEFQNAVYNPLAYQTRYSSGFVYTIPNDSVISFRPTFIGGAIMVSGGSSFTHGLIGYVSIPGSVWAMTTLSGGVNLTTGVLTGTTGTINRLNISASGGLIYIENRLGTAPLIAVKTLPSSDLYV